MCMAGGGTYATAKADKASLKAEVRIGEGMPGLADLATNLNQRSNAALHNAQYEDRCRRTP